MRMARLLKAFGYFLLVLAWAALASAQEDPEPSRDPAVFKAQLRQAAQLCKRTMQDIQALSPDDTGPVDPRLRSRARQTYVTLRAAWWGMGLAKQRETSYKDPMLDLAYKRIDQALPLARFPVDYTDLVRSEYISRSVQGLSTAIKLINQALVIRP